MIDDAQSVFRFAPSPNGLLHLGHAYSALIGYDMAQRFGGRFLVRIEDIDLGRRRPQFIGAIFEDLAWLGIEWETPVLFQSDRFDMYRAAADTLRDMGLLYPCFATRAEIAVAAGAGPVDPDGAPLYPGLYKGLARSEAISRIEAGEPAAWRIDMTAAVRRVREHGLGDLCFEWFDGPNSSGKEAVKPDVWGDAILVRKDVPASYHIAVVIDDAAQNITHVVRGQDLRYATDLHRLLQLLLGLPSPRYHHHKLITDGHGRKLAKSQKDQSLKALRDSGAKAKDIRALVGL